MDAYYIMDYSQNYYRLDSHDQLVATKDVDEATVFAYNEAVHHIGAKKRYYQICSASALSQVTEAPQFQRNNDKTATESCYDMSEIDWLGYTTHLAYIISGLKNHKEALRAAQSDIDTKISDIMHYIEFAEINNEDAGELIALLQSCRVQRRKIKDGIAQTEIFQKYFGTAAGQVNAKDALRQMQALETRRYTPRKFSDLFEHFVARKTEPKYEYNATVDGEDEYYVEYDEEKPTRRETAFDGKGNDWLDFVKQQALFFKDVGQYITNLKLDLETIDAEIRELQDEIEGASSNVVKEFIRCKKLKSLLQRRKKLQSELNRLDIMTRYLDVGYLADEYLAEVEEMEKLNEANITADDFGESDMEVSKAIV